jgi:glycosyltransferase involved in cell wall biosynthesis
MVSIIICVRDLQDLKLQKCLKSLYLQTYKHIEIILESEGSIVEARQRGIRKAKGEYICLVDADQVLPCCIIKKCVKLCENGWDGVTWTERGLENSTFCEKVIDYDKMLFHSAHDDDPIKGAAEPRFFKAEFVKRLDFSKLPPITFELTFINKQINDMGAKIAFSDEIVYHHEPRTFRELFRKFFRYGYYYIPSLKFDRETVLSHSKPRRVYFDLRALNRPVLYVGLWWHYFVKAIASSLGAIYYLLHK